MGSWYEFKRHVPKPPPHTCEKPIPLSTGNMPAEGSIWRCACGLGYRVYKKGNLGRTSTRNALHIWDFDGDTFYLLPYQMNFDQPSPFQPYRGC